MRARLLFGDWRYDDDPTKLIEFDKILDLWTNTHVKPGPRYITCDVARFGEDDTVIGYRRGRTYQEIESYQGKDLMKTVGRLKRYYDDGQYEKLTDGSDALQVDYIIVDDTELIIAEI